MKFNSLNECLDQYYRLRDYCDEVCISASSIQGEEEVLQGTDGQVIKTKRAEIPQDNQKYSQFVYAIETRAANMPIVYDYVIMCIDVEKILAKRTTFEQRVLKELVLNGRVEALDHMLVVYGLPTNCGAMNDIDKRLDEIVFEFESDLREADYI